MRTVKLIKVSYLNLCLALQNIGSQNMVVFSYWVIYYLNGVKIQDIQMTDVKYK